MLKTEPNDYTYVHVVCELQLHLTESRERVEEILKKFMFGDIEVDERFEGTYLLIKAEGTEHLQILHDWITTQRISDTVRSRLYNSIMGNITAVYFNRQAAYMDHLSLVDRDDSIPLGSVSFQIVSDGLEKIIDLITPRTYNGRVMNDAELERYQSRIERKKELKKKDKERQEERDNKFIQQDQINEE